MVNEKISSIRKAYWANLSDEERSTRMTNLAKKKQSKLTPFQKRTHGLMMAAAKKAKKTPPPSKLSYGEIPIA